MANILENVIDVGGKPLGCLPMFDGSSKLPAHAYTEGAAAGLSLRLIAPGVALRTLQLPKERDT